MHDSSLLHVKLNVCPYVGLQRFTGEVSLQLRLLTCGGHVLALNLSLVTRRLGLSRGDASGPAERCAAA